MYDVAFELKSIRGKLTPAFRDVLKYEEVLKCGLKE